MKKIFIFFLFCNLLYASFIKVTLTTNKKEIYLGDRVKFKLKVISDLPIKNFNINLKKQLKGFYVTDIREIKKRRGIIVEFYIQFFTKGEVKIPKIKLKVNNIDVYSNPLTLNIKSNLKENTEFRDVKNPIDVGYYLTIRDLLTIFAILIFIIACIILFIRIRRKNKKLLDVSEDIYILPIEEAQKNIEICRKYLKNNEIKKFYYHLSYTLRKFIDRKFKLNTLDMTIDEIKNLNISTEIKKMLERLDEIKFRNLTPDYNQSEKDLEKLVELIRNVENYKS